MLSVGVDFGTCNSTCSVILPNGEIHSVVLENGANNGFVMPSWWYYRENGLEPLVGSLAKDAYINDGYAGRFITSVKTHLRNLSLRSTSICGRPITLEEIVSEVLKKIRTCVEAEFGGIDCVYAGRPVNLADITVFDKNVEGRISHAFELAGFKKPVFILEPVAAAMAYKRRIEKTEVVLVADFGGGTLDYSVMRLNPTKFGKSDEVLGVSGVRLGGEDLTASAMQLFWKDFGYGCDILDLTKTKYSPFPQSFFSELSQWTNLWKFQSLREKISKAIWWGSTDPDGLNRLLALLDDDCYYDFLSRVEALKFALTDAEVVQFEYNKGPINISRKITREDFESNVARHMERAKRVMLDALNKSRVAPDDIEAVFLTGGSSQVPAFKKMITTVFDPSHIQTGAVFTSVAEGLAAFGINH